MIDYDEDSVLKLLFYYRGSVAGKAALFAVPSTLLCIAALLIDDHFPEIRADINFVDLGASTLWSAGTAALVFLIGFRSNRAIMRFWEGTGLLHQMRGEWFDTVSNCVSFSIHAGKANPEKSEKVKDFRHVLVRLMSLAHGYALEEISGNAFEIGTIDVHGLDRSTRQYLKECHETCGFNKVEMSLHLIQSLITDAFHAGVIDIPAPILSRVFQTISRGFVHLLNTKKITDTKFPFPYTQLIAILLVWFAVLTPVLISSFVTNKVIAAVLTFLPVWAMSAVNYVAMEIENPFGRDDNDLPMDHFQKEMDSCLLMLLHPFADTVPTVGGQHLRDFGSLFGKYGAEETKVEDATAEREAKLRRWDTKLLREQSNQSLSLEIKDSAKTRDTSSGSLQLQQSESNLSSSIEDTRTSADRTSMDRSSAKLSSSGDGVPQKLSTFEPDLGIMIPSSSCISRDSDVQLRIGNGSSGSGSTTVGKTIQISNAAVQTVSGEEYSYEMSDRAAIPLGLPWRLPTRPVSSPRLDLLSMPVRGTPTSQERRVMTPPTPRSSR